MSTSRSPHGGRGATWWRPPPRTLERASSTWWSNVCDRPSRAACSAIRRRAPSSVIAPRAPASSSRASGAGMTNPSRPLVISSPAPLHAVVMAGQAAGEGLEDGQRAGVVIGRRDEEVARPVAGADVGDETGQVDRPFQAEPTDHPEDRRGLPRAADEQVDGPRGGEVRLAPGECRQQRLQALEPVVMADEEPDQVVRLQPDAVPEGAADRPGLGHLQAVGVDGVGDHA